MIEQSGSISTKERNTARFNAANIESMGATPCSDLADTATKTVDPGLVHSVVPAASSRHAHLAAGKPQTDYPPARDRQAAANQTGQTPEDPSAPQD